VMPSSYMYVRSGSGCRINRLSTSILQEQKAFVKSNCTTSSSSAQHDAAKHRIVFKDGVDAFVWW
jgi:hypothetical protein